MYKLFAVLLLLPTVACAAMFESTGGGNFVNNGTSQQAGASLNVQFGVQGGTLTANSGATGTEVSLLNLIPVGTAAGTGANIFWYENVTTNQMAKISVVDTGVNTMGTVMRFFTSTNSSSIMSNPALTLTGTPGSNLAVPLGCINCSGLPNGYWDVEAVNPGGAVSKPMLYIKSTTNNTGDLANFLESGGATTVTIPNDGGIGLYSRTVAQLQALSPKYVGEQFYCSNCTALRICVSTGTAQGAFSSPVAATTACN